MTPSNNDPEYGKSPPSSGKTDFSVVVAAAQADANGDGIPDAVQLIDHEQRIRNVELKVTKINFNTDIIGLFEVVSAAPSGTPKNVYDQVKIYTNGTTYRLYWYDQVNHAWRYATGT